MPIRTSGATSARSSADQDQEDDEEDQRRDHGRVPAGGVADVEFDRGRAADERLRGDFVGGFADRFDQVEGGGRVRVRFERRLQQRARRPGGDRVGDFLDPGDAFDRGSDRFDLAGFGDDDVGQPGRPRGEALVDQVLPFDRFDFVAVGVFAGQVGGEGGEAGAEDEQEDDRAAHHPPRRDRDPLADPRPEAVGRVGGVLALVAADLVGGEDAAVERADDQRGDAAAAEDPQQPVEQDQRQR